MQDVITREIIAEANQERVYMAIADPKQIVSWFPDIVEGSFEVGQRPIMTFSSENHTTQIYIEAAKPHEYFAYRWVPGDTGILGDVLEVPNTLVEFIIEPQDGGTKVTVKESGFASLPAEVAQRCFNDNSGGWEYMIGRLEKVMNQA